MSMTGYALILLLCFTPLSHNIVLLCVCGLLVFMANGMLTVLTTVFLSNSVDYGELKTGKREESVVSARHSFFRKLAQGVGPAAVIAIMGTSLIGYESALGTIGQSAETAGRLCWLVAGLYLFSAVLQFIGIAVIYNLDKKTMAQMNAELAARKAE